MDECKPLAGGDVAGAADRRDPVPSHSRAVHVDPIKTTLKAPGSTRLKLECDILLSTSDFKLEIAPLPQGGDAPQLPRHRLHRLLPLRPPHQHDVHPRPADHHAARAGDGPPPLGAAPARGRGLHSLPSPLNWSLLCPSPLNLRSLFSPILPNLTRECVPKVLKLSSKLSDVSRSSSS